MGILLFCTGTIWTRSLCPLSFRTPLKWSDWVTWTQEGKEELQAFVRKLLGFTHLAEGFCFLCLEVKVDREVPADVSTRASRIEAASYPPRLSRTWGAQLQPPCESCVCAYPRKAPGPGPGFGVLHPCSRSCSPAGALRRVHSSCSTGFPAGEGKHQLLLPCLWFSALFLWIHARECFATGLLL